MRRYLITEDEQYSIFLVKNLFAVSFNKKEPTYVLTNFTGSQFLFNHVIVRVNSIKFYQFREHSVVLSASLLYLFRRSWRYKHWEWTLTVDLPGKCYGELCKWIEQNSYESLKKES